MSSTLTLNIGLKRGRAGESIPVSIALLALETVGQFDVVATRIVQSSTERTLVAQVRSTSDWGVDPAQAAQVFRVAQALDQEAIAAFEPRQGHGVLVGPDAAAWGAFDPAEFFTIEGRRLSPRQSGAWGPGVTRDQSEDRRQPFSFAELAALGACRA